MAGLVPGHNIRLTDDTNRDPGEQSPVDVVVQEDEQDPSQDREVRDNKGALLRIEHPDGSITISTDGGPIKGDDEEDDPNPKNWFTNLAAKIPDMQVGSIVEKLMRGIDEDITSRSDWISQRTEAMKMLGLKIETPDTGDSADGAAVEGMSRVRHPMMLEAVLRFQANAMGEMLPVDGPVKIRDDGNRGSNAEDDLADALQKDFNHFLTVTDKSYYPDTDRMFLRFGFGGLAYKKVYYSPLLNRPISEYVDADALIVNSNAVDLSSAKRVTHRLMMTPSLVRRMQILGVYRDVPLSTPNAPTNDPMQAAVKNQEGIAPDASQPEDRDREVYECYCELDLPGFEHQWKGKPSGLEVPYRVTIDVSSRQLLSLVRDYDRDTADLPIRRETFVEYVFVPGFGYYPIGLAQILGNTTNAVTAAWRIMLDNGMFANFPGGLIAKAAGRQNTNIQRVPPGSFIPVETNGMPIGDAVHPLPYNAQGMPAMMSLTQDMVQQGQRVGTTSEQPVGEGRQDAPVGTTLALIEQAQKILNSVHKRMHSSQARELQLIAKCFKEHPESFWQQNKTPAHPWDEKTFLKALADSNLVPQSDPNTASQVQRLMKLGALIMLAEKNPTLYDPIAIARAAVKALGYSNPEQFLAPPESQGKPTAEQQNAQAETAIKKALADAQTLRAQSEAKKSDAEIGKMQQDMGLAGARLKLDTASADTKDKVSIAKTHLDGALKNKELDQDTSKELVAESVQLIDVAQNLAVHPEAAHLVGPLIQPALEDVLRRRKEQEQKQKGGLAGAAPPDEEVPPQ